jgi:hypothetical protein
MEWTLSPIILLKPNITLPDYVLVDFKASSVKRVYLNYLFLFYFSFIHLVYGTN